MSVPNTFNLATGSIPLSQLDANFAYYDAAFSISGTTITFAGTMNGNLTGNVSGNAGAVTNGVYLASAQTLTNKTISGSSNTLSNIGNASLTNSAITINGSAINLGGTVSVGTVTSVGGTGTVNGLTLTGTVTSTGNLTLGGTLDLSAPPAIGTTTPSTGAFTTLSASGNVTLGDASTDTLNVGNGGIVKDASGNVGMGRAPNYALDVYRSGAGSPAIASANDSMVTVLQSVGATQANVGTLTSHPLVFITANAERVRVDTAGNVGIGTNLPSYLLDLNTANANQLRLTSGSTSGAKMSFVSTSTNGRTWGIGSNFSTGNGEFAFYDYTASAERMRIDSSGNVGIGTSSPSYKLDINTPTVTATDTYSSLQLQSSSYGYVLSGGIKQGAGGVLKVSLNQAGTVTEVAQFDTTGNLLITSPAGLGYGTGSGGTVTQATSKSTAVTLNKPTGQITMNGAALAAGAQVGFVFVNSLISATDVLVVSVGNTWGSNYRVKASTYAGAASIYLTNESAASLSEAVVLNFAIIKGATA